MWIPPIIVGLLIVVAIARSQNEGKRHKTMPVAECEEMIQKIDQVVNNRDLIIRQLIAHQASEALAWKRQLKLNNITPLKLDHVIAATRNLVRAFSEDTLPLFENDGDNEFTANDIVAEALAANEQTAIRAAIRLCANSTQVSLPFAQFDDSEDVGIEALCK